MNPTPADEYTKSVILVIDDEVAICQGLMDLLAAEGYRSVGAYTGVEALQKAESLIPDLVLLDVMLPDMTGFEVCQALRASPLLAEVPIILVTSLGDRRSRLQGFEAGADDFISKPIDQAELLARVRTTTRLNRYRKLLDAQTRHRKAEEALQESEARFHRLAENVPDVIYRYRFLPTPGFEYVNSAVTDITGYTPEEHYADPELGFKLVHPDDQRLPASQQTPDGIGSPIVLRWVRKDGRTIWTEQRNVPIFDEAGRLVAIEGVARDITERKRAEEALRRQLEELLVLHAVATAGAEAKDEDTLIAKATQIVDKSLDADCFGVFLLNEQTNILHAHASHRPCYPSFPDTFPLGRGVIGDVALDGQPRLISLEDVKQKGNTPAMSSKLCVPMQAGDQLIGVVNAASAQPRAFTEDDQRLLLTFAHQLATAVEKVRLMNQLEQRVADRTRELAALYDVTAIASESLNLHEVLDRALTRALVAIQNDIGLIHLTPGPQQLTNHSSFDAAPTTPNEPILQLTVAHGLPTPALAQVDSIAAGEGLIGQVLDRSHPLVISNAATTSQARWIVVLEDRYAYVGLPIRGSGHAIGVLSILLKAPAHPLNVEEMALLASIADHIGVAVENAHLRQQAQHAAILEERERLSRELHDAVTQSLYGATLMAETGRRAAESGDLAQTTHYLDRLGETTQQALKEMRLLVHKLRPPVLEREGLVGALQRRLDAVEKRAGVDARLLIKNDGEAVVTLPANVEKALYRIAQEALNNSLRHARATTVTVQIDIRSYTGDGERQAQRVTLAIIDDGRGFDPQTVIDAGGMGLTNMRERAERLGGELTIESTPGEGTRVRVKMAVGG
ncbi:MAG TPA: response regulator [Chloroflexi bacterium]|nr:response regulator [Chloroflexota bacterium]